MALQNKGSYAIVVFGDIEVQLEATGRVAGALGLHGQANSMQVRGEASNGYDWILARPFGMARMARNHPDRADASQVASGGLCSYPK